MKGRFLKKLNIISTLRRGLALQHLDAGDKISDRDDNSQPRGIPGLRGVKGLEDDQEDDFSSSVSVEHDFEDANSSEGEVSSDDTESCSPREDRSPETVTVQQVEEGGCTPVVFYSTSMRGVRKTFEDCTRIRFLLRSFRVKFDERDVSMHREYREELWKVSGEERAVPPKLFVRGRLIGGADEVTGLHERGELRELLEGILLDSSTEPCAQCGNFRFVICSSCSGSCRIVAADTEKRSKCTECNENGLVRCPICR